MTSAIGSRFSRKSIPYYRTHGDVEFTVAVTFTYTTDLVSPPYNTITVREGFKTDLASVPRLAKAVVDNDDVDILYPAIIHDLLYRTQPRHYTRLVCDKVLVEGMENFNSSYFRRAIVYRAVRLGGWVSWYHNANKLTHVDTTGVINQTKVVSANLTGAILRSGLK